MIINSLSVNQKREVYRYAEDIIDNLDEYALREMMSGNEADYDKLFDSIIEETACSLYTDKGPLKTTSFHYLDKLVDNFNRELAYKSLNYFILSILSNFELNHHHLEWGILAQTYNRLGIIASRDHGKSFFFSHAYPLWQLYRYERNAITNGTRNSASQKGGMIITNEHSLAKDFLKMITEEVEDNAILKEKLFPRGGEGTWGKEEITCRNKANLKVKGAGAALRGRHLGWIVVDDLLNDDTLYSQDAREAQIEHFHSVIMNMIVPGGQVIIVGTPFHLQDLYGDLKSKKGWRVFEYPAIYPDGSTLWSDRYSLNDLLLKRDNIGNIAFTREFLVTPVSSDTSIFPWNILQTSFRGMDQYNITPNIFSFPRKFKKKVLGTDFAISGKEGSDYSVFITLGVDEMDNFWLLNMWRKKGATYNEQIATIKHLDQQFNYDIIMGEDNGFQQVMIQLCKDNGINMVEHTTTAQNKYSFQQGIPAMAVLFEQGRYKFPRGDQNSRDVTDMVCNELNSISFTDKGLQGVGSHDDIAMSLWISTRAAYYIHADFNFNFLG